MPVFLDVTLWASSALFAVSLIACLYYIWRNNTRSNGSEEVFVPPFIDFSVSFVSAEDAEDQFFRNEDNRIKAYYNIEDGFQKFYSDQDFSSPLLNAYYCDGFYTITVKDESLHIDKLV